MNRRSITATSLATLSVLCLHDLPLHAEPASALQDASEFTVTGAASTIDRSIFSPLPADAAELAIGKAAAEFEIPDTTFPEANPAALPPGPKVVKGFAGSKDPNSSPPDTTGAVGTTRYIEPLNRVFKIWDKSGAVKGSGTLAELLGWSAATNVFDPQVIWDPDTQRFYITAVIVISDTDNRLAYVFSKTASPNSAADFCKYYLPYGAEFPDYPKLGDVQNAALIGVNVFVPSGNNFAYVRSDLLSFSKPAAATCAQTIKVNFYGGLKTASGAAAFTPVPANQIDTSTTGWIVGRPAGLPAAGATELELWKVTSKADGTTTILSKIAKKVAVAAYKFPPAAPQPGAGLKKIDTSDTRLTQAVSAINPNRRNAVSLWTQHTTLGGAGAEVRWYEINAASSRLFASGKLTSSSLFYFNGAISPNRAVNGRRKKFGESMIVQASGSSARVFPSVYAASKVGNGLQSAVTLVKKGTQSLNDFACTQLPECRWGDYAGLTPDPTPPAAAKRGRIWGNNELGAGTTWSTWNFAADIQ